MMKTTTLRRKEGGTKAAAGTVARAGRGRAVNEGAASNASGQWLEAEQAIWAQTEKPLSHDTRFVLIGNLVTITKHGRWQGAWGFVRWVRDGWMKVELSSFSADGSEIELPVEDVTYDRPATGEQGLHAERSARLKVMARYEVPALQKVLSRRSERLRAEVAWLQRNSAMRTLTHQSAMRKLGITSNHITAIVPWTGVAA